MFLCCGEALIDMVPLKDENGQQGFTPIAGGAIFNTAISMGRLERQVGLLSSISSDLFGQQLVDNLHASQVDASYLVRPSLPTTLAFVQLIDSHASYTFYDENSAGRSLTESDLPAIPESVNGLYFGGISLISEPAADAYASLAEAQATDKLVVLDPNIRTSFITDETSYRSRLQRIIAVADLVKVSDEDLAWLQPQAATEAEAVAALRGHDAQHVIVTRGAEGTEIYLADGSLVECDAVKAQVVDTVGAGDTFNAGVLASLDQQGLLSKQALGNATQDQWYVALGLGAQVAAVTVSRAGANPPWLTEL